ncbi:glycosyltransferase family 4 protein [Shimia marina]|uniref:Glycosyltransferase KanE n=1 Tax=Shimia marina TaxID=321267 RepID=A0A0P1ELB7_9RHOB|nr:glycosyltransferase family 4 protein [Shimia marina]CUH51240.1 Glycosyltransferase KanE [Shimia marina]SFD54257.1 Glycosyltransferase involved in cell wall bisynthesis [Shimia marina]
MARIAFYAPLKSPHHPVPSGERQIARNMLQLLRHEGHDPVLASELRSFDKHGDLALQERLLTEAEADVARLITQGQRAGWHAWVTYHSYYKAPDLLGPAVSAALGIPYLLIEATRASKRLGGPWDRFERRAAAAIDAADAVFHFTERDAVALREQGRVDQRLVALPPFLAMEALPAPATAGQPVILVAGMMRAGDKLSSYRIVAEALARMPEGDWQVEIAGDGPMRAEVEALLAPFGARVRFLGQLDAAGMAQAYARARVFLWPGVNEAFGMVYLEAQAHGVPVVAEDRPGVNEVVDPQGLRSIGKPAELAAEMTQVLSDARYHQQRAARARDRVAAQHLLPAARERLWGVLAPMLEETQ